MKEYRKEYSVYLEYFIKLAIQEGRDVPSDVLGTMARSAYDSQSSPWSYRTFIRKLEKMNQLVSNPYKLSKEV